MPHNIRKPLQYAAAAIALAATPVAAQTPMDKSDGEWLTLSGTVESASAESFVLDYGGNSIPVEMDDYDWYNENAIMIGDEVTVTGVMDNDFFQTRRIEAHSVYVDSLRTRYFASPADEEDAMASAIVLGTNTDDGMQMTGYVESIAGDEMIVDAGFFEYKVDTGELYYDPFDADGITRVDVGDRIVVSGRFDDSDFFDTPEVDATSIVELSA